MTARDVAQLAEEVVASIRDLYRRSRVEVNASHALGRILAELEDFATGLREGPTWPASFAVRRLRWIDILRELAAELNVCADGDRDIRYHLGNIREGELELGAQSVGEHRIYLKDYWFEVHLLARLLKAGINADFSPPGDEVADIIVGGDLMLQAKHPSSPRQLPKQISKFARRLRTQRRSGLLCIGVEDLLRCGQTTVFDSERDFSAWRERKIDLAEVLVGQLLPHMAAQSQLLGMVVTCRFAPVIAKAISVEGFSSAFVFNRQGMPQPELFALQAIGGALAARVVVVPPVFRRSTAQDDLRREMIQINGGPLAQPLSPGDRVGFYRCAPENPKVLAAYVFECVKPADHLGPVLELTHVVGTARTGGEVAAVHHDVMVALGRKQRNPTLVFDSNASDWFQEQGVDLNSLEGPA